jgi:NADPH:quinone reductase-like Zn-dependent oxidoreductase
MNKSNQTMKAIRIKSRGQAVVDHRAPVPRLRDDHVIVKTRAVALNPADWKFIDQLAGPGETAGFDYSGVVEQVGAGVHSGLCPGDRVAGMSHGCWCHVPTRISSSLGLKWLC